MRTPTLIVTAAALMTLGACAAGSGNPSANELRQLTEECQARNGILVPRPGGESSEVRANYQCEIRGGPPTRSSN